MVNWPGLLKLMKKPLQTLFQEYLDYCANTKALRTSTIKTYREVFRRFCDLMPEVTGVEHLTPEALDQFFTRLGRNRRTVGLGEVRVGVRPSTTAAYGSKLHSFFDWLCVRGHLAKNPVDRSQLPKVVYTDKRALTRREVEKILAAISQNASNRFLLKRNLAIISVFLFAGLRRTELLSLKVHDVDLEKRTIHVSGETSKSKFARTIPISFELVAQLEDYMIERRRRRRTCAYLWVRDQSDDPFTAHGLKHLFKSLCLQSGVPFHAHRFRHTYACMLGRSNVSAVMIQKLLGHTDLRMTQTYLRSLGAEDMRASVQSLSLENLPGI